MATSSNLSSIIRFYAEKQNSPFIDLREFCTYVKKYAEHHVEQQAELVKYLGDPTGTITAELEGLSEKHLAAVVQNGNKKLIVAIPFIANKYAEQYKEMLKNEALPYPSEAELSKIIPQNALERKKATNYIYSIIDGHNQKSSSLYILEFDKDLPPIVLPASITLDELLESAQAKIRKIVKKDENHDFYLKKLRGSNPSKEISLKHFFTHYIDQVNNGLVDISEGDDYYLWNQLCYYIRQDYEKIQDKTVEDINVLQAIQLSEIHSSYLKEQFQNNKKREDALKELDANLKRPPYFYTHDQIIKFKDQNGRLLCERYSNDDLNQFMKEKTTPGSESELAEILFFKINTGVRYYICKQNVLRLIIRLCNEAHEAVQKKIVKEWNDALLEFEKLPAMSDNAKFERLLEQTVEELSPVLHGILTAGFLTLMAFEKPESIGDDGVFRIFDDHKLVPYSELLMIHRGQTYSEAKMELPFYYSIPVISWFIAMFHSKKKKDQKKKIVQEVKNPFEEEAETASDSKTHPKSKEAGLAQRAHELTEQFVPVGSTIDRELNYLVKQWNTMLNKDNYNQLTDDVNALIRDYTRKVMRSLSVQSFTKDRLQNLADALVRTPNLQKIRDTRSLTEYVTLYMLRLVGNFSKK